MDPLLIVIIIFCISMLPVIFYAEKDSTKLRKNRDTPIESAVLGLSAGEAINLAARHGYDVRIYETDSMFSDEYNEHRLNIRNQENHVFMAWIG